MEMKFAEYVIEYLLDKLCSDFYEKHLKPTAKNELKNEIYKLKQWIGEFINRNEASIIDTGEFDRYFSNHAVLDTLLEYVTKPERSDKNEKDFLQKIVNDFKGAKELQSTDRRIMEEFLQGLLSRTKAIYYNRVPDDVKILLYPVFQMRLELNEVLGILRRLSWEPNINSIEQGIISNPESIYPKDGEIKDNTYIEKEAKKYELSWLVEQAIEQEDYLRAAAFKEKIAQICRKQGKERDAHLLEHSAFELREQEIYRSAQIDISFFDQEDLPPNVELMKAALSELARQNKSNGCKELYVFYTDMNIRICEAQNKQQDAALMQGELQKYLPCLPLPESKQQEAKALIKRTYYIHWGFNARDKEKDTDKADYFFTKAVKAGWEEGSGYL